MGTALSAVALLSNSLWPLLVMGGGFLAESLSVIIQVWLFKATKRSDGEGKRVFQMSTLHHHFELVDASEQQVGRSLLADHLFTRNSKSVVVTSQLGQNPTETNRSRKEIKSKKVE